MLLPFLRVTKRADRGSRGCIDFFYSLHDLTRKITPPSQLSAIRYKIKQMATFLFYFRALMLIGSRYIFLCPN